MQRLELIAVGLDHCTAGIALRERVTFADAEIPAALERLTDPADPVLEQAVILSTCNRVELYGAARSRCAGDALTSFLARYHGLEPRDVAPASYVHRGDEPWVFVSLPAWNPSATGGQEGKYFLRVTDSHGHTALYPGLELGSGNGAWGTAVPKASTPIRSVALVDDDGRVWCSATLST